MHQTSEDERWEQAVLEGMLGHIVQLPPLLSDAAPGFSEMCGTRRDGELYAHVSALRASGKVSADRQPFDDLDSNLLLTVTYRHEPFYWIRQASVYTAMSYDNFTGWDLGCKVRGTVGCEQLTLGTARQYNARKIVHPDAYYLSVIFFN